MDLEQFNIAQIISVLLAGGGMGAFVNSLTSAKKSNIDSCLSIVEETKERVSKLEDDNSLLNQRIIEILSDWKKEVSENLKKIATLEVKIAILENEKMMEQDKAKEQANLISTLTIEMDKIRSIMESKEIS